MADANEYWTDAGVVRGPLPESEGRALTARSMASIADPLPLGLGALAATTWTISTVMAGWHAMGALPEVIPIAVVFGGIAQFLAGMWAFRRGSTLLATAFSTFSAFFAAFGVWLLGMQAGWLPNIGTKGNSFAYVSGWFIITFGVIAGYLAIAALADNLVLAAIFGLLCLALVLDGVGTMVVNPNNWATYIGGYAGIVTALLAFYLSAAAVINASFHRVIVPTFTMRTAGASPREPTSGMRGPTATSGV